MFFIIILWIALGISLYFAIRYFALLYALKKTREELGYIQKDLTQNQALSLPLPDKHLGKLLLEINGLLEKIQEERQQYDKREKDFQKQIENISHDLRTPLTVILGYIKLLKSHGFTPENEGEQKESLEILEKKAISMEKLVSRFYDYSRLTSQDYSIEINKLDSSRLLKEALAGNYQLLSQSHLLLQTHIPEKPVWVWGEETSLERIFQNLLQNAERYGQSCLCISLKETEEEAVFSFSNDTRLLTPADRPYLFQRFYKQDSSRGHGGTGLGLTVARLLAEQMGGSLQAEIFEADNSETDSLLEKKYYRLCFYLKLPLVKN